MTDTPSDNGRAPTDTLSVTEAAVLLGVSERTVWRRIKAGKLPTVETADGVRVRLPADDRQVTDTTSVVTDTPTDSDRHATDTPSGPEVLALVQLVDRLQRENQQLAGQLGFVQAKLQDAEEQIRLLMAPQDEAPKEPAVVPGDAPAPVKTPWWRRLLG